MISFSWKVTVICHHWKGLRKSTQYNTDYIKMCQKSPLSKQSEKLKKMSKFGIFWGNGKKKHQFSSLFHIKLFLCHSFTKIYSFSFNSTQKVDCLTKLVHKVDSTECVAFYRQINLISKNLSYYKLGTITPNFSDGDSFRSQTPFV